MARPRAQDYDTKRSVILNKSAELIAHFGFAGTSITMIADACKVSKANIFHYYSDKEEVLFDIIRIHLEALVEVVETAYASSGDVRERVGAISVAILECYRNADAQHQVQISSLKLLPDERRAELVKMERRLVALLSDALAQALFDIKPRFLKPVTMSMFGMLNWHYLWFRESKGLSREQYARLVTELILSGAQTAVEIADQPRHLQKEEAAS